MRRLFYLVTINISTLLLLPVLLTAQASNYYFTRLTEKDGLTDNNIGCILQDKTGFMWIGTYYGLNRYDGYTITRFTHNPADTTTIGDNYITSLVEDKNGVIWVGTSKGGVNRYNPATKTFTHLYQNKNDSNSLYCNEVNELYVDKQNRLWIGYFGKGWSVYNQQQNKFTHYKIDKVQYNAYSQNMYNNIDGFAEDNKGNMWVTTNAGLYYQDEKTWALTEYRDIRRGNNNFLADNLFVNIYMQNDSTIWLSTWAAGIKKFNTHTHEFTQYLYDKINPVYGIRNIVLRVAPKSSGELWIASVDKGLGIFNESTGQFKFLPNDPANPNSPLPHECAYVYTDRQGSLWAGYYEGLAKHGSQSENFQFTHIQAHSDKFSYFLSNCFFKDTATGLLYTGGEGGKGLYVVDDATGKMEIIPFTYTKYFAADNYTIYSIAPLDKNRLLLMAGNGLNIYNKQTKTIEKLSLADQEGNQLPAGYRLMQGPGGSWWYSSYGIFSIDSSLTKAHRYYEKDIPGVKNLDGILLVEDASNIWLNSNDYGLEIFNTLTGQVKPVVLSNGNFSIVQAACVMRMGKSEYWVSCFEQGLFKLVKNNDGTFTYTHYSDADNVPNSFIKGITKDGRNNYWIATRKGPLMYVPGKKYFKLFGEEDGYNVKQWAFEEVYPADDGNLYFPAENGYARCNIDSLQINKQPSPLVFTSLKIAGKEWADTTDVTAIKKVQLAYNQNFFSAEFVLLNYIGAESNKYAYMLEGVDKDFVYSATRRYISYADLAPGTYTLRIKASNNDGLWNNKPLLLTIVVEPPFWRTWLFYCLVTVGLGGLIFMGYRYHIGNIRKEEKLKTAFNKKVAEVEMKALRAQMNPHFIFNCLNSINRYIIKSDHITASHYLTRFSKLIRLILDNSVSDTTTLESEIQLVHLYLEMEQLRFEGKFSYSIETDPDLQIETIKIPSMLIQPYAENAIWHGLLHKEGSGHICIRFKQFGKSILNIEIEDDGVGREKSAQLKSKTVLKKKSYGMQITGDRINIVNELYNIKASAAVEDLVDEDGQPAGTKITLQIPFETTGTNYTV